MNRSSAGDILFRIDPKPYEFEVQQRKALLAEAEQNVSQLKSGYESALSAADAATAQRDTAKKAFDRFNEGNENAKAAGRALPFSIADVENRRGAYLAAEGAMQSAIARAEQARITYQSQIDGVHTSVARLRAELRDAEYNLELTTVRAPGPRDSSHSSRFVRECTWCRRRSGRRWCSSTSMIAPWRPASSRMRC